ncbi:MAG: hypothetical protein ACKE51_08835 [Methylococcaceae bacterium]
MPNTIEQRLDLLDNCDILLKKLEGFEQIDETPEGRMLAQLNWLKERAENNDLTLPIHEDTLTTLRYIYADGGLSHLASDPKDMACINLEIKKPMNRLLSLTWEAKLLLKPEYYPYAMHYIDALLETLIQPIRPLDQYEHGLINELRQLRKILEENIIELPLMSYMPGYPNFIEVDGYPKVSIADLPNGEYLYKTISNFMFNGVRPDSWFELYNAEYEAKRL